MDIFTAVQQFLSAIPPETLALVGGAVGVSAFIQKIKHWLELESPRVIQAISVAVSIAAAAIPALLGLLSSSPAALGEHGALFFTALTLSYQYVVKPLNDKLTNFRNEVAAVKIKNAEVTAPVVAAASVAAIEAESEDVFDA